MDPQPDPTLHQLIVSLQAKLSLLSFGAFAGATLSAFFAPEESVMMRIAHFLVMFIAGVALGGVIGSVIDSWTGSGPLAYSAGGAVAAYGARECMEYLKTKIGKSK